MHVVYRLEASSCVLLVYTSMIIVPTSYPYSFMLQSLHWQHLDLQTMTSLMMMSTSLPPVTLSTQHVTLMSFRSSATFPRARTHSTRYSCAVSVRVASFAELPMTQVHVHTVFMHWIVLANGYERHVAVCRRGRLCADTSRRCGCSFSSTWVTRAPSASCSPASRSTSCFMRPPSSVRRRKSRRRSTCRQSRRLSPRMRSSIAPTSSKTVAFSNLLSLVCHVIYWFMISSFFVLCVKQMARCIM